jgi:hypothetical protein
MTSNSAAIGRVVRKKAAKRHEAKHGTPAKQSMKVNADRFWEFSKKRIGRLRDPKVRPPDWA